ncbi:MAG: CapA family protein, partial [Nitriliruptorales bacterium]|nr:CapA family protein [Nitriliruptorales bacterium]
MSSRTTLLAVVLLLAAAFGAFRGAIVLSDPGTATAAAAPASEPSAPSAPASTTPPPRPTPPATAPPPDAAGVATPDGGPPDGEVDSTADPVVLAFAGDVHGEKQIAAALGRGEHPLADIAPPLRDADLTIVNLETAVGISGTRSSKQYTFQAPSALLDELVWAGVDVVNLANNHSLDLGREGLLETLGLAERAGLEVVGAGRDDTSAYAPFVRDIRGLRIAVVGLTRVWPHRDWAATVGEPGLAGAYDIHRAARAVAAASSVADVVIVTIHWGTESEGCPDEHQLELAAALQTAGADVVVGHHPHVLQGVVAQEGRLVAYSLGNFLWYASGEVSRLTGVLRVELTS